MANNNLLDGLIRGFFFGAGLGASRAFFNRKQRQIEIEERKAMLRSISEIEKIVKKEVIPPQTY